MLGLAWRFGSDGFSLSCLCGFLKKCSQKVVYVFKGLPWDAPPGVAFLAGSPVKTLLATVAGRFTPFPIYYLYDSTCFIPNIGGFASRLFPNFRRQMLTIPYIDESPSIPLQSIAPCLDCDLAL